MDGETFYLFWAYVVSQLIGSLSLFIPAKLPRRLIATLALLCGGILLGIVAGSNLKPWFTPLAATGIYQLVNTARIIENRSHIKHLRRQVWRSSSWLLSLSVVMALVADVGEGWSSVSKYTLLIHAAVSAVAGLILLTNTIIGIRGTRTKPDKRHFSDEELPTVSVLISARNEDAALAECIHTLLKSDYQKLEIIVLDDCSQDSSSDIIKSYAQRGVRFIPGEEPSGTWLAKNQAYHVLSVAASGQWLLFMSVDVRLEPSTIRHLITYSVNQKLKMVSVVPRKVRQSLKSDFFAPLRTYWELAIPPTLRTHMRPAVMSTIWMVDRSVISKNGGFEAVSRSVSPEGWFAKKSGAYQFMRASEEINVRTSKPLGDLYSTAIRMYYPENRKEVHRVFLTTLFGIVFLVLPYVLLLAALVGQSWLVVSFYLIAIVALGASNLLVITVTNPQSWVFGFFNLPIAFIQEVVLLNISMYRYEFTEILWKGRNICYPVMHIVPRLPGTDHKPTTAKRQS